MKRILFLLALMTCAGMKAQQPSSPIMGMMTWNVFEDRISDQNIRQLADAMVDLGLQEVGYSYICIDDHWALPQRDAKGHLQPNPKKFPQGFRMLTDYIHSRGLKAGIYSDAGHYTCSKAQPGSLGHEQTDAKDFGRWGFDLLKYDFCHVPENTQAFAIKQYGEMQKALKKHGKKDMVYYVCEWGRLEPWLWAPQMGASCWRATDDTRDCWENATYKGGVLDNIKVFAEVWPYTTPGHYNDADMLMCGLHGQGRSSNDGTDGKGMTQDEYRTQFILWCMWSSPLMLCFDITTLYDGHSRISDLFNPYYKEDLEMITHREMIAVDQDPLGKCAEPVVLNKECLVLLKPLDGGDYVLSITNLANYRQQVCLDLGNLKAVEEGKAYQLTDIWNHITIPGEYDRLSMVACTLKPHATEVYRISQK